MQQMYWRGKVQLSTEQHKQLSDNLKSQLGMIRFRCQQKNDESDDLAQKFPGFVEKPDHDVISVFIESVKDIYTQCGNDLVNFVKTIVTCAVGMITQKPPCSFTVVGIGSLARGEATPYSDLEYLFLLHAENKSVPIMEYFETLAVTTYFLIGNLGETKLSYMAIEELQGWFDDQSQNGMKIDGLGKGAGNIPTGNGLDKPHNHFIMTYDELLSKYQHVLNNPEPEEAKRGDLTAMLTYTRVINDHTDSDTHQKLREDMSKMVLNEQRKENNLQMLRNDITKFDFKPSVDYLAEQGFTANVKKQLYRFPSILLLDLAIIFKVETNSSWDLLDELLQQNLISKQIHHSLRFLLACSCFIRMAAYLSHNSQDDRISLAPQTKSSKGPNQALISSKRWYVPVNLFIHLSMVTIPLKRDLEENSHNIKNVLQTNCDKSMPWTERIKVMHTCARYSDALKILEGGLNVVFTHGQPLKSSDMMKYINLLKQDEHLLYVAAEILFKNKHFHTALAMFEHLYETKAEYMAQVVAPRLVNCCNALSLHDKERHLLMTLSFTGNSALHNLQLGQLYNDKKWWDVAESYYIKALQEFHNEASAEQLYDYYGEPLPKPQKACLPVQHAGIYPVLTSVTGRLSCIRTASQHVIVCLAGLGDILVGKSQYLHAKAHYQRCMDLYLDLFGEKTCVPLTAALLNRLGNVCRKMRLYQESEQWLEEALVIYKTIHGSGSQNIEIARILSDLGQTMACSKNYVKAKAYYQKSLAMKRVVYQEGNSHVSIAHTLNMLGISCFESGQYDQSLLYYQEALALFQDLSEKRTESVDISRVTNNIACVYIAT